MLSEEVQSCSTHLHLERRFCVLSIPEGIWLWRSAEWLLFIVCIMSVVLNTAISEGIVHFYCFSFSGRGGTS